MTNTKTNIQNDSSLLTRKVSPLGGIIDAPNFGDGVKRGNSETGDAFTSGFEKALSPLGKRKKVIQDYFDLYVKSGIMEFFAGKVRRNFDIPQLTPDLDYQIISQADTNGDAYDLETSDWYEGLSKDKQEELSIRIKEMIKLLYLPRNAFKMILHYCLYGKRLDSYPFYDMDMISCIAKGEIPDNEFLGYSKNEVEFLKASAIILLGSNRELIKNDPDISEQQRQKDLEWIEDQMRIVPKRCADVLKNLERKNRPLRDLEMNIKIIQILKDKYKKKKENEDNLITGEKKKRIIKSKDIIIDDLFPDIHFKKFDKKAAWYRSRVRDLMKKYPFLQELIDSSKQ